MRISTVLYVGIVCLTSQVAFGADLKSDVEAAYEAWNAAFNEGDAAALGAFYTEDAKLLPPTHEVMTGPAGAEQFFTGLFEAGVTNDALEIIEVYGDADADVAYSAANWTATGKGQDGSEQQLGGIAVHGFERQSDGSLKLNLHTFN
jgi:ketosteroid isomerase-like protein